MTSSNSPLLYANGAVDADTFFSGACAQLIVTHGLIITSTATGRRVEFPPANIRGWPPPLDPTRPWPLELVA